MLETERTILRPFTEDDAADLYDYARDPRVGPAAGWKPHESIEESREIIRTVFSNPHEFAIVDKESGRVIGSGGFVGRPQGGGKASDEIGYVLSPQYWGRGIMPEVVRRLIRYGFEDLGLTEIWCGYYEGNDRSRRVGEKCGFLTVLTQKVADQTGRERVVHMSVLLRQDWERKEGANG